MTPAERWRELKEMTEDFNKKNLIRHHVIRTIKEALAEVQAENEKLWRVAHAAEAVTPKHVALEEALSALYMEKHVNHSA